MIKKEFIALSLGICILTSYAAMDVALHVQYLDTEGNPMKKDFVRTIDHQDKRGVVHVAYVDIHGKPIYTNKGMPFNRSQIDMDD
ncbi:MAG: hypothetical protein RLZZ428_237 [Pseudomonadota bacterium]